MPPKHWLNWAITSGQNGRCGLRFMHGNSQVQVNAAEALIKIGDDSAEGELWAALGDANWAVQSIATEALAQIGDASAVEALRAALDDDHEFVRRSAAEALGKIGDASAVGALRAALDDDHEFVRRSAAEALGKIGDVSAVEALRAALLTDGDWFVRRSAAEALGKIGDAKLIAILWQLQLQPRRLYSGDDYTSATEAIQNRCQFYNLALYQQGELPLPPSPTCQIPAVAPSQMQINFNREVGAVNIDSNVHGSAIGNPPPPPPPPPTPTPFRIFNIRLMTANNINFSGASIGGVNITSTVTGPLIGTQHNYAAKQDLAQAAEEIQSLLQQLEKTHPTDIQSAVQTEISTNPSFYERLCFMLQAGAIESLKALFPPVGIPIEMVKSWVEAQPINIPKEDLPPSGF